MRRLQRNFNRDNILSASQEIAGLLDQWHRLTQEEAGAIQYATWPSLRKIQSAKAALQTRLTHAREKWASENPGQTLTAAGSNAFRMVIARLLSLEARNAELLAAKLRGAEARRESLNEAVRNLRNVHQKYSLKPAGALNCCS
jgi:hypothetical protein